MIVVDSAAVVDALTMVDGSEGLREELAEGDLHAPALLDFEVVSALRGLTLGGGPAFRPCGSDRSAFARI